MKKQSQATSYFKKIFLAIAVTFCWVTAASANQIYYNFSITQYGDYDWNNPLYTGVIVLDMDTQVTSSGNLGDQDLMHTYSISYEASSTDGQFHYSGGGSLWFSSLWDIFLTLDDFAIYWAEEGYEATFDPPLDDYNRWHDPDFDVTRLSSMTINSDYSINSVPDYTTTLFMEQVSRVPEPSVLLLMAAGLIGLGFAPRKTLKA